MGINNGLFYPTNTPVPGFVFIDSIEISEYKPKTTISQNGILVSSTPNSYFKIGEGKAELVFPENNIKNKLTFNDGPYLIGISDDTIHASPDLSVDRNISIGNGGAAVFSTFTLVSNKNDLGLFTAITSGSSLPSLYISAVSASDNRVRIGIGTFSPSEIVSIKGSIQNEPFLAIRQSSSAMIFYVSGAKVGINTGSFTATNTDSLIVNGGILTPTYIRAKHIHSTDSSSFADISANYISCTTITASNANNIVFTSSGHIVLKDTSVNNYKTVVVSDNLLAGGSSLIINDDAAINTAGIVNNALPAKIHMARRTLDILFNTPDGKTSFRANDSGSVIVGNIDSGLLTTATDGFLYIPTCSGTPTGIPTTQKGHAAIVWNSLDHRLQVYSGGEWKLINETTYMSTTQSSGGRYLFIIPVPSSEVMSVNLKVASKRVDGTSSGSLFVIDGTFVNNSGTIIYSTASISALRTNNDATTCSLGSDSTNIVVSINCAGIHDWVGVLNCISL